MHECKVCGASVSYSLVASVCFVCARKIRSALNLYEDTRSRNAYQDKGNPRASELYPLTSRLGVELGVGVLPLDATGMVCGRGHVLKGRVDHCGQVKCEECDSWVNPK